jgi:hypothetical protein
MKHEYAHILQAVIDGKTVQHCTTQGLYIDLQPEEALYAVAYYTEAGKQSMRVKPGTITVGDVEVPVPRTTPPEKRERYWTLDGGSESGVGVYEWDGDYTDRNLFEAGQCWNTKEEALVAAKAIAKLLKGE